MSSVIQSRHEGFPPTVKFQAMYRIRKLQCPRGPAVSKETASLRCQLCWSPLSRGPKSGCHQCLFCDACLRICQNAPIPPTQPRGGTAHSGYNTDRGSNHSNRHSHPRGFHSNVSPQDPHGYHDNEGTGTLISGKSERHVRFSENVEYRPDSGGPGPGQESVLRDKLRELDRRATRCGFCPRHRRRGTLVRFCVPCHKHLCSDCSQVHSSEKLYKYHATIDLVCHSNQDLL